jgi:hypothetical protein
MPFLFLFSLLTAVLTGCATERVIDISAARIEAGPSRSGGMTAVAALDVFRSLAGQFGLSVEGPVPQPKGEEGLRTQYLARPLTNSPAVHTSMALFSTKTSVIFYVYSHGGAKGSSVARKIAAALQHQLGKGGVKYSVSSRAGVPAP